MLRHTRRQRIYVLIILSSFSFQLDECWCISSLCFLLRCCCCLEINFVAPNNLTTPYEIAGDLCRHREEEEEEENHVDLVSSLVASLLLPTSSWSSSCSFVGRC